MAGRKIHLLRQTWFRSERIFLVNACVEKITPLLETFLSLVEGMLHLAQEHSSLAKIPAIPQRLADFGLYESIFLGKLLARKSITYPFLSKHKWKVALTSEIWKTG